MAEYPECDRMVAASEESQKIGDFLDWLNEQGIVLAEWERQKECDYGVWPKWRCEAGRVVGHPDSNKPGQDDGECPECNGTGLIARLEPRLAPRGEGYEQLLARFFGIDLKKIDAERSQMLAALRSS